VLLIYPWPLSCPYSSLSAPTVVTKRSVSLSVGPYKLGILVCESELWHAKLYLWSRARSKKAWKDQDSKGQNEVDDKLVLQ
jgi:hypothetical protein